MLSISPTRRNDSIPEPHLKMTVNNESHSFLVDTGATVSSVQCSLALQTTGQHEMLQGFDGIPHPYPLTVPVPVQYEGIRIMHQFVVTNNLDINVLGRDLLCRLQLLLVCQPHSIEVEHAQHRQCYQHRTPQWWSLDLEDQEHHVTLAYDASGSNSELEQFFGPHEGSQWTITELATVTGREGEALAVSISMSNWRQSPGIAPHLTLKVYFPYTAKDLGPMVFQALKGSDENTQGPQQVTSDLSITYSPTRPTQEGTLRHHKGRDIVEFTDPEVWADDQTQVGLTNVEPVLVKVKPGVAMPSIQQYPLKVQAVPCIDVLLKGLLKQGILITCQSCCNTPILAVPKPGKPNQYRLVQDLRAINAIVQPLHALVPNPAHILATIPAKATVFGSVDLQHAFFSIPLHPDCQYLFAFTYNGQQYTWTRLPQGFVNSPTLFSRCLQQQLQNLQLPEGSALIQYVDDLLVASETEEQNREAIILLLNFVKTLGYVVSPSKVHVGQKEVKFLGVIISAEGRRLDESRTDPIYRTAPPTSARGMRQWLGMINYCRQWIPNVALDIKHLTPYTSEESTFVLSGEALTAFNNLREALQKAPALGRPLYDRPFQLYCTVLGECATAVLTQLHGDKHRPVAYYSSKLDPVALGYPHCTQVLTAVYNSLQSAANLTLQQDITVYSSHSVTALLGQLQTQHLTSARQNKYEIYLLNNPKLQFRHCTTINPAAFLCSPPDLLAPCDHNCLEAILADTSPRPDLSDQPLASPDLILYTDGSSSINEQGRRLSGFAVVKQDGTLLDCGSFDPPFSAQQAELFALTRACVLAEGHSVNIYTDSRYAFGVVHDFGQLWKNRGFLTSTGHKIANQILVSDLLNAILLPSAVAVIKCAAHTTGESPVQIGNRLADDAAKCASRGRFKVVGSMMRQVESLYMGSSESEKPMPTINDVLLLQGDASANVIMEWEQLGCRKADSGLWLTPAGQTCMTDQLATWVVDCLHVATHCGATLLVDALLQAWWHPRLKVLAAQTSARCLTCATHNPGKGVVCQTGRTPLPTAPFETLQMDFIDLPKCQCYKHVLVIVDVFSRWIEAFPTTDCTASTVVSILLRQVVPRFGVPNTISSDNGPHFIAAINKELYRQLGVTQRLHCAYRPQAAGMVERLNQTLKTKLAKLVDQSGSTWVKMLPVALFQIRVLPAGKTRLSPAEIIYGRPLRTPWTDIIPATMTLHHMTEEMIRNKSLR
ncbi:uncharacterized protein LOC129703191 [Leucoraja erinacea]|uniref:uncharacterized protein LOC129703191 n=1 Tax=Leucoraja erinaceus TaxID=7782 RepID=UPI002455E654|nr:uncharacterized protein LOC129703191 [Leucoraja erinacea]